MEFKQTKRGQLRAEFQDRYGALCSIQESSIPGEDCVWLGVDVNFEGEFMTTKDIHGLEDVLVGTIHDPETLRNRLSGINVADYITGLENEVLLSGMF